MFLYETIAPHLKTRLLRIPPPAPPQEGAAQVRKVRPKSMPQAKTATAAAAKLEDVGIKVEPTPAADAAAPGSLMPKQRLLIKIPRSAVTAATAHAAEVAAAAAAVKDEVTVTDVRTSKRGKAKSGVKRARPLAGTRSSPPPPPPPAPTSRQVCFGGGGRVVPGDFFGVPQIDRGVLMGGESVGMRRRGGGGVIAV